MSEASVSYRMQRSDNGIDDETLLKGESPGYTRHLQEGTIYTWRELWLALHWPKGQHSEDSGSKGCKAIVIARRWSGKDNIVGFYCDADTRHRDGQALEFSRLNALPIPVFRSTTSTFRSTTIKYSAGLQKNCTSYRFYGWYSVGSSTGSGKSHKTYCLVRCHKMETGPNPMHCIDDETLLNTKLLASSDSVSRATRAQQHSENGIDPLQLVPSANYR